MGTERILFLLKRYADNTASREEVAEVFRLIRSVQGKEALKDLIMQEGGEDKVISPEGEPDWEMMWATIQERMPSRTPVFSLARIRVAAAVLILLAAGWYYWRGSQEKQARSVLASRETPARDIRPGGNRAVLTLGNGSTIILDSAHTGMLAQQGGAKIVKLDAGALSVAASGKLQAASEITYNTIATPRGGQYEVVLPDGSKVWLNAASSLRFPTQFSGGQRMVELKGEAYFEVAKNAAMPFHVKVGSKDGDMDVEVLGTSFNVMAYDNEQNSRTTLLEGKVRVMDHGASEIPEPGRQVVVNQETHAMKSVEANTELAVAWKNGLFRFKETDIRELMRQVERWYDVEVVYKTDGRDQDYTGIVPRNQNVSALLKMLEMTGTVHFQIEGRKIIVLP